MKYEICLNRHTYEVEVELDKPMLMQEFQTYTPTAPAAVPAAAPTAAAPAVTGPGERVDAPMPGTILKVNAAPGQAVKEGDVLCILEAMKMENEIMAPKSGTVTQVLVCKGACVDTGATLVVMG